MKIWLLPIIIAAIVFLALLAIFDGMEDSKVPSAAIPTNCVVGTPQGVFRDSSSGKDVVLYSLACEDK